VYFLTNLSAYPINSGNDRAVETRMKIDVTLRQLLSGLPPRLARHLRDGDRRPLHF
jgi:hypothetical protein